MLDGPTVTTNVLGHWARLRAALPRGHELPVSTWNARHRFILVCAAVHVPLLAFFGWRQGWAPAYWIAEPLAIAALAWLASVGQFSPRLRAAVAGLALVTSSAVLVQFSGGYIEAHFHYFIVVALVALYEDYVPFLLAIGYVAVDHGLVGSLAPSWVYNHDDAAGEPWKWAGIHAAAILAESVALLGFWAGSQQVRARSDVVLHSTSEGILGTDLEGRIVFANPAAAGILGRPEPEIVGKALQEILPAIPVATEPSVTIAATPFSRPGGDILIEWSVTPASRNGSITGSVIALRDITGRRRLEEQVVTHARLHSAIARLGQFALEAADLGAILDECVRQTSLTLGTELCKVLEVQPEGNHLLLRAGHGWRSGLVGTVTESTGLHSQAGYTLVAQAPIVVEDLRTEKRFSVPKVLLDHGAVSGMSVVILASRRPWGVLGTLTTQRRTFTSDEANFLQAVSNLIGSSVERDATERALHTRNRQQATVAALGHDALSGERVDAFLARCARDVAAALDVEFCKVLELEPDGAWMKLRAGVGWRPGLVGTAKVPADLHSQAGYALRHDGPVIVRDVATETRFSDPVLLKEHGVVSGMSVLIKGREAPFGVLGAHAAHTREFTHDDIHFLQAVANLIATAIERHRVEDELLTHRMDLEGLVERRTAELTEANRELEAFSYTVSHDLRSPLRSIDGFSRILQQRYASQLPPEARELLDLVHDGAIRMGNLIESVLTLSRVNRTEMMRASVDVSALATEILQELEKSSPGRSVVWTVQPGLRAMGDEGLLRLAFQNLLANAWKFTAKKPDARIRVLSDPTRDGVIVVEDNGAGFDMADARELFQPFHRLHHPSEFPGTGIGLATVSRILQRHGGHIWADAAPDRGARFMVQLPPGKTPGKEQPGRPPSAGRPPRPLVEVAPRPESAHRQD